MTLKKLPGNSKKRSSDPVKTGGTISSKQLRVIWALASRLGFSAIELHMRVESMTGKKSIRMLGREEAQKVIGDLILMAGETPLPMKEEAEERFGGTDAQIAFINGLTQQLGWNFKQLEGLAKKMFGIGRLRDLTVRQASGLIEALKAISKRHAA
jgi:hypothetical protein